MSKLSDILAQHRRVAIVGGPRTGKTTAASRVSDREVIHADDHKDKPWKEQPHILIAKTKGKDAFVIEGVQVGRALRKGMEVDAVVYMHTPVVERTKGQAAMAKGAEKIMGDVTEQRPELKVYEIDE